jgi:TatD DNase family protein
LGKNPWLRRRPYFVTAPSFHLPLYDAHCHLQDSRLQAVLPNILANLKAVGLRKIVVNGTRESDWDQVLQLAAKDSRIIPSIGLHPWYINERSSTWLAKLKAALISSRCALGEIGLDRWIKGFDSASQEEVFVQQLNLAAMTDRPVSIHCLKAWGRLLEILKGEERPSVGFLLHSYGGPAEMVRSFAELGGYFSFSGYFAHPRKVKQREVFREIPSDRLLIETDAPDMAPPADMQEFSIFPDGNHPANIRAVYKFAAEMLNKPLERLATEMEANFQRLFAPCL